MYDTAKYIIIQDIVIMYYFIFSIKSVKLFSLKEDKSITVNMLLSLLLLFALIANSHHGNYLVFIFITFYGNC